MKLSRALLIVLVLHVVAVAGIIAFNTIKTPAGTASGSRVERDRAEIRASQLRRNHEVAGHASPMTTRRPRRPIARPVAKEDRKSDSA